MGNGGSNGMPPRLAEHTALIVAQYNIRQRHLRQLFALFEEMDENKTSKWTIIEYSRLLETYPESLVTPCLEGLVKFGSSSRDGRLSFEDFLVATTSYCGLSKEELLQYVFILIDSDRSGVLSREELENFFSASVFARRKHHSRQAVYPPNYLGALTEFGKGQWKSLVFEEFCLMCDLFPHLAFPAVHLQMLLRRCILGSMFWKEWDSERLKIFHLEAESKGITFKAPNLITGEIVNVVKPGRITMKEIFEFTKRKGLRKPSLQSGFRLDRLKSSSFTADRDTVLTRAPLLSLVRNPNSVYHVPLASFSRSGIFADDAFESDQRFNRSASHGGALLGALDKANEKYVR